MTNAFEFLETATVDADVTGMEWLQTAPVVPAELMEQVEEERERGGPDVRVEVNGEQVPASQQERLSFCGVYMLHKPDVRTGRRIGFYSKCDLPLLCPRCREARAEKEAARVAAALDGSAAWLLRVPEGEDTARVVRGIDAHDYRRYPMPDGETWILHRDADAGGDEVPVIEDLPWEEMVRTPEGSNMSGKLRKDVPPSSSEKENDDVASRMVKVPAVAFDDPMGRTDPEQREDADRAWEFAILATDHIPAELGTLYMLLPELMRHYRSAMENCGYRVRFFVYEWQRVREDEIDWETYRTYIRKKLQRQGYTSEAVANEDTYTRHYKQDDA